MHHYACFDVFQLTTVHGSFTYEKEVRNMSADPNGNESMSKFILRHLQRYRDTSSIELRSHVYC